MIQRVFFALAILLAACSVPSSHEIMYNNGVAMRIVPAGEFMMGSDNDSSTDNPKHRVYLDAFYMDVYEVTNGEYEACVKAGVCQPPPYDRTDFRPSYYGSPEYGNFPVIYVDWYMAQAYCEWRDAHLPTEAEWEKAARGTDERSYPWGEGIDCDLANYDGDPDDFASFCVGDTSEVGSYENGKGPYGLYDMSGNVFEWVSSLNKPYPYDATDGREDLTVGGNRLIRGGAWSEGPDDQRVFYRSWLGPEQSESVIGLRRDRSIPSSNLM